MQRIPETHITLLRQGGELEHEDLIRLHEEDEQDTIAKAEQREKARAEEKRRKKEQHDFCSSLRMSDEVYR